MSLPFSSSRRLLLRMIQKIAKIDKTLTTPTPSTIPRIRPILLLLLLGGLLLTVGMKSVQHKTIYQIKNIYKF